MKFLTISLLSLTLALNAFAVETKICVISSDVDAEVTELRIETDSNGNLDTIRLYATEDGKVVQDDSHPIERAIAEGIVASQRGERKIVVIRPKNFSPSTGGIITLDHLYNGIKGTRRNFDIKIAKVAGKFVLSTVDGTKINRLFLIGNHAPIVGLIGIKEIKASFR